MRGRFDSALMEPPLLEPAPEDASCGVVRRWCEAGAFPRMTQPLAAASIAPQPGLDGVACELDGSHALARLGRVRGLAWRLQVLLQDHLPGRPPQAADPWDCGWWRSGALAAAQAFRPRRATLLLVREADAPQRAALLAALQRGSPAFRRPLRVLALSTAPLPGLARLASPAGP